MIPQIGQLVSVRNRSYIVNDVSSTKKQPVQTKVSLECIDNDKLGEMVDLIWERENVNTRQVFEEDTFPNVMNERFDKPAQIDALESAIRWSAPSMIEGPKLLAPFRGSIQIEDYQLEPVSRALRLPRVNLLIADDVGLGKTIEAGLVLEELMARGRVKKTLVVAPASLTLQWQSEMIEKFQLEFKIIDRDYLLTLRREYGINANPFTSYPRLIISMDYFKRDQVKQLFDQSLRSKKGLKSWDLLIVDEAHNAAPTGKQKYVRDSDRTKLLKHITPHFEHKLFLTATPHNGFTHSFTGLLELLDPLRFNRGPTVNQKQLDAVMIRRLKEQINTKNFAKRTIDTLYVLSDEKEREKYDLLDAYIRSRLLNSETTQIAFAMTMLKKRLLSSPLAFSRSIGWHKFAIDHNSDAITDEKLLTRITHLALEDYSDDEEKEQNEEIAISETSKVMTALTQSEKSMLERLVDLADETKLKPDTKAKRLLAFIAERLKPNKKWNNERLIIFTEYKDSLEYLQSVIGAEEGRILTLSGGDSKENREIIKAEFQKHPDESKVRILLATDAASEGLNLQHYCRYLIHYEIPWNPNKMEQRNGRIDRHGQSFDEVFIYHFLHEDNQDSQFLQTLVDKVQTMREDLGSISDIVEKGVEEAMLGRKSSLGEGSERQEIMRKDMGSEVKKKFQYEALLEDLKESKEILGLNAQTFRNMVDQALRISGKEGVLPIDDLQWKEIGGLIKQIPSTWHNALKHLKDKDGHIKKAIFEPGCDIRNDVCEIIHLSHPIAKYAISEFRKELFGFNNRMSRMSYKIIEGIDVLHLKASTRVIITGKLGHLLHEEVLTLFAKIDENGIEFIDGNILEEKAYSFDDMPMSLSTKLRLQVEKNKQQVLSKLNEMVEVRRETLDAKLRKRANTDAKVLRELIDERIDEVTKRLKEIRKEKYKQMSLFTFEEEQQYKEDERWLEIRLEDLKERRITEPDEIKEQYNIKDVRSFFLSLVLYIPSEMVKE